MEQILSKEKALAETENSIKALEKIAENVRLVQKKDMAGFPCILSQPHFWYNPLLECSIRPFCGFIIPIQESTERPLLTNIQR